MLATAKSERSKLVKAFFILKGTGFLEAIKRRLQDFCISVRIECYQVSSSQGWECVCPCVGHQRTPTETNEALPRKGQLLCGNRKELCVQTLAYPIFPCTQVATLTALATLAFFVVRRICFVKRMAAQTELLAPIHGHTHRFLCCTPTPLVPSLAGTAWAPSHPTRTDDNEGIRRIEGMATFAGIFAFVLGGSANTPQGILASRDRFEMIRPYTVSDPAKVINDVSFRDHPNVYFIRQAVRHHTASLARL
jgi:hypothetical protein